MTVDESYAWTEQVARSQAKNFYYSFLLLSAPKRRAMCAIYAFMRYCDDLSDNDGIPDRAAAIARWRDDLESALARRQRDHPLWPAFVDAVEHYKIPHTYFFEMIEGVSSDLEPRAVETFDELYRYCYHVASVVGLSIIHIFGFEDPRALDLAEKCGIAFQLTNILRDIREDAALGRIYLPAEDLTKFGVPADDLKNSRRTDAFGHLMDFETARARCYYRESAPLVALVEPDSRSSLRALIAIYSRLLDHVAASPYDVLTRRISLSAAEKVWIVLRALMGFA